MANADACRPEALLLGGDRLSAKEIDEVLKELRRRQRELRASESIVNDQDAALRAAEEYANDLELAAIIEKRNEALNLAARTRLQSYVQGEWADRPVDGLEAALVGVQRARSGGRKSIAAEQRAQSQFYVGRMLADLKRAGVHDVFASGALDREVANALFRIEDEAALAKMNPEAVKVAKVVHEWQERARLDANKAGAWIKKMPGYIVRQSHDARKIDAAGFGEWRAFIKDRLDFSRTFAGVPAGEIDDALRAVYDGLSTGVHLTAEAGKVSGFKGFGNLAKKLSQERALHFKDADAWFDYNQEFGSGNIREAVAFGLTKFAHATALMRTLGTNPEANLEAVFTGLQKSGDNEAKKALDAGARARLFRNFLPQIDGRANRPANHTAARYSANVRAVETYSSLGGAVLSSTTDLPFYAAEMQYQGRNFLSGMAEAAAGLRGRRDQVSQEILASLGVFFESAAGELVSRFSANDTLSGAMSRGMRLYFKANLQSIWTDSLRATAGLATSNHLAQHVDRGWAALPQELQRVMSLYGIDSARWSLIRKAEIGEHNGRAFLSPDGFHAIPDADLKAYLKVRELPATGRAVDNLRDDLARQLRMYVADRVDYAVLTPDAKTRAYLYGGIGNEPGTFAGELRRFIFQFKAFPSSVIQRVLGRAIYGRGADTLMQALKNGNGELLHFANILIWTTMFGYGAMALKDIAKGREPRTADLNDPKKLRDIVVASMLQGGALGIYGDFLLGETSRFGRSPVETAAGPALGDVADLISIKDSPDKAAAAFRFAINNAPGINLFYTRAALDYLFLYQVQEYLNPGSVRRMEQRVKRENNQSYFVPPSSVVQ